MAIREVDPWTWDHGGGAIVAEDKMQGSGSEGGSQIGSVSITLNLSEMWTLWPHSSQNSGGGTQQSVFLKVLEVILMHAKLWEL